mmetsp:Transcript_18081/g.44888  ORF Transcript_18081/g.44888 Transcript_18081/m.44888 type:complete len:356 (-) Transcript_18081:287-1354(-)
MTPPTPLSPPVVVVLVVVVSSSAAGTLIPAPLAPALDTMAASMWHSSSLISISMSNWPRSACRSSTAASRSFCVQRHLSSRVALRLRSTRTRSSDLSTSSSALARPAASTSFSFTAASTFLHSASILWSRFTVRCSSSRLCPCSTLTPAVSSVTCPASRATSASALDLAAPSARSLSSSLPRLCSSSLSSASAVSKLARNSSRAPTVPSSSRLVSECSHRDASSLSRTRSFSSSICLYAFRMSARRRSPRRASSSQRCQRDVSERVSPDGFRGVLGCESVPPPGVPGRRLATAAAALVMEPEVAAARALRVARAAFSRASCAHFAFSSSTSWSRCWSAVSKRRARAFAAVVSSFS